MKYCPNCGMQLEDDAAFCQKCGASLAGGQPYAPATAAPVDPYDHTATFDAKDISDHKVFAMLGYLLGTVGIIIALLASRASEYTMFHVRQALKFTVVEVLMLICAGVLFWTFVVPIAYAGMTVFLTVVKIICFFQICAGKAKEPIFIRSLKFLK